LLSPTPETVVSTGFAVLRPTTACGSSMLTTIAGSRRFADYLQSVAQGSAYPAVHPQTLGRFRALLPGPAEARAFEIRTMPLRRRAAHAAMESRRLAGLRDALLPELLTGRLRVPEGAAG
jgi:type I restriction enzyme S subunit